MPRDELIALAGRAWLGSVVRSGAAIVFPSIALLSDRQPSLGILLYLTEVVLTAFMLVARTSMALLVASRTSQADETNSRVLSNLRKTRDLAMTATAVGLLGIPFLLVAVMLAHPDIDWPVLRDTVVARGSWLAVLLLASALVDTLVAPVRSPEWLHAAVSMQLTRGMLLHPVILFGFLIFGLTGSLGGMVVIFVAIRLALDVSSFYGALPEWRRGGWLPRPRSLE